MALPVYRYWRITLTHTSAAAQIRELALRAVPGGTMAPNRSSYNSSDYTVNYGDPAAMLDANTGTTWTSTYNPTNFWLILTWPTAISIAELMINPNSATAALTGVKVEGSADRTNWTTVIDLSNLTGWAVGIERTFPLSLKTVEGYVLDESAMPAARRVDIHRRDNGGLLGSVTSAPVNGMFTLTYPGYDGQVYLVAIDDEYGPVRNSQVLDRITPVEAKARTLSKDVVTLHMMADGTVADVTGKNTVTATGYAGITERVWDKEKGWVVQLTKGMSTSDGNRSTSYPTIPANEANLGFLNNSFCIECWFKLSGPPGTSGNMANLTYLASHEYGSNQRQWNVMLYGATGTVWNTVAANFNTVGASQNGLDVGAAATPAGGITTNVWHHFAVTLDRVSGRLRAWYDGQMTDDKAAPTNLPLVYTQPVTVGQSGVASWEAYFNGWMCDFRITRGDPVYTQNFTPPARLATYEGRQSLISAPVLDYDPLWDYAVAALHHRSAGTIDLEAHTLTLAGNAAQVTTQFPLTSGYSVALDGTGDYISVGAHNDFPLGYSDFTIEGWFFIAANSNVDADGNRHALLLFIGPESSGYAGNVRVMLRGDATTTGLGLDVNLSNTDFLTTLTITQQQWHHFEINRVGAQLNVFLDGIRRNTFGSAGQALAASGTPYILKFGGRPWNVNYPWCLNGNIAQPQLLLGVARHGTQDFDVPTTPSYAMKYRKDWASSDLSKQTLYGTGAAQSWDSANQRFTLVSAAATDAKSKLNCPQWRDFDASWSCVAGAAKLHQGLVYRTTYWGAANDTYGYTVTLDGLTAVKLERGGNSATPAWAQLAAATVSVAEGATVRLRVTVVGAVHTVYLNGAQVLSFTDATYASGGFGLRNYGSSTSYFDDLMIAPL